MQENFSFCRSEKVKGDVLMEIRGNHNCFVCNHNFNWMANISDGKMPVLTLPDPDEETIGEAIAIKRILSTTQEPKTLYEIKVTCPHCRNKNRFSPK